jgi:hypothetical protein
MKNRRNSGVVEDIWINTQVGPDDMEPVDGTGPDAPASWNEIEEENILLNPDAFSMEDRG